MLKKFLSAVPINLHVIWPREWKLLFLDTHGSVNYRSAHCIGLKKEKVTLRFYTLSVWNDPELCKLNAKMFETLSSWQFRQFLAVLLSTKRRSSKIISTYDIFHCLIETVHITNFFPLTCNHSLPLFARVQMRTAKKKFFFTSFNKTKKKQGCQNLNL